MKVEAIAVCEVDLPLTEDRHAWPDGRSVDVLDSPLLEIVTDNGVHGDGEACPLGPFALPAFGAGASPTSGDFANAQTRRYP